MKYEKKRAENIVLFLSKYVNSDERKKVLRKMKASFYFYSVYLLKGDEFVGPYDYYVKNNFKKIVRKKVLKYGDYVYYYFKLDDDDEMIFIFFVSDDIKYGYIRNILPFLLSIFVALLFFGYLVYILLIRPIETIVKKTEKIIDGDYSVRIEVEGSSEIKHMAKTVNMLTEKVESEISLLNFVINNMNLGFFIFDENGEILVSNKKIELFFGDDLRGKKIMDFLPFIEYETDKNSFISRKIYKKDGTPFFADIVISRPDDKFGENVLIMKYIDSIKENDSNHISIFMKEIASVLSHEIKNPLNVISMIIQILRKKYDDNEMFDDIEKEVDTISYILSDFSSFFNIKNEKIVLPDDIFKCVQKWALLFEEKGIKFSINYDKKSVIVFDRYLLEIMLTNIFKNSYEVLEKGNVVLLEIKEDRGKINLKIRDSGKGIDSETIAKLLNSGYTTKRDGSGFGMFIVRLLMKVTGGVVEIESKPFEYTEVRLIFETYENSNY